MPIYEFKCKNCGKVNEFIELNFKEINLRCNFCGSGELIKSFSKLSVLSTNKDNISKTCCGREERCDSPPCNDDGRCRR